MTKDRLRISTDGIAGPYLMLPLAQLAGVRQRLDRDSVDGNAISLDGKPAIVVVNFGRAGDATRIQALFDEVG